MKRAFAALLLGLAACGPASQSADMPAAPAHPAPSPITPTHNGGRFAVEIGRSFEIVLDPAIPPATLWRLAEIPAFVRHLEPRGGSIMGGELPQTSMFTFFAFAPGEGDIVLTAPDGAQFRVTVVASEQAQEQAAPAWRDPLAQAPVGGYAPALRLGVEHNGTRVEAALGQHVEVFILGSPSRGDALEATSVPAFLSPTFDRLPSEDEQQWGGSTMMSLAFVVQGPGEGELVIRSADEREGRLGPEVFRATIVAR